MWPPIGLVLAFWGRSCACGGGREHNMTTTPQRYESLAQAAEHTGISTWTLRRRIASGQLTAFTAGRRIIRLRPEDVDALLVDIRSWSR